MSLEELRAEGRLEELRLEELLLTVRFIADRHCLITRVTNETATCFKSDRVGKCVVCMAAKAVENDMRLRGVAPSDPETGPFERGASAPLASGPRASGTLLRSLLQELLDRSRHDPDAPDTLDRDIGGVRHYLGAWEQATKDMGMLINAAQFPCSFCGRTRREVNVLIAAPRAFICDDCVATCAEVIESDRKKTEAGGKKP